jgi:hypothetical protein
MGTALARHCMCELAFTERASHTCLLQQQQPLDLKFEPSDYLQFNQKIVISVPEHLHVQSLQTAATGKGRTNKISWLNLPFILLMSAAGILEGLFSCLL